MDNYKLKRDIIKIAHRGFRVLVDENTKSAFDKSVELGMDYIECDIRRTKDRKLVILHDSSLKRTYKPKDRENYSSFFHTLFLRIKLGRDIQKLNYNDCLNFESKKFNCPLPLVEETLRDYVDKIGFMLEIKDSGVIGPLVNLVKELESVLPDIRNNIVYSSQNVKDLKEIIKIDPSAKLCLNITSSRDFPLDVFNSNLIQKKEDLPINPDNLMMISLSLGKMNKKFIDKCKDFGIKPLCWNFLPEADPISSTLKMIDLGIEGILFDHYEIVRKIRN